MIDPLLRLAIIRAASWVTLISPMTLTSNNSSISASEIMPISLSRRMPALLTRMSRRLCRDMALWASAVAVALSATEP